MAPYLLRRLLAGAPVLLLVSVLVFGAVRILPGDVCRLVLQSPDADVDQATCAAIRRNLGLDRPLVEQYFNWVGGVFTGDFGKSLISQRDVLQEIRERMYVTVELAILSGAFALLIGLLIGVYSALKQDKPADFILRILSIGWLSMPNFWIATLLITFPAIWWGYRAPVQFRHLWESPLTNLEQLALPAISIGLSLSATLARMTRSSMLEVLRQDYVRTARAKGLRGRTVVYRHALKNAMLPVVTLLGLQVGVLLSGTVILETIFGLPGLGTLLLTSVQLKDYTQVQGLVLFFAVAVLLINIAVDVSYAWLDPRVRFA